MATIKESMDLVRESYKEIESNVKEIINNNTLTELDKKLASVTKEEIKNMSFPELMEFTHVDNECIIKLPDFGIDRTKEEVEEYLKYTLIFLIESGEAMEELEKRMLELDKIVKTETAKLSSTLDEDVVAIVRDTLKKAMDEETNPERIEKHKASYEAFEDSFTLNRIKELYKTIGFDNIQREAKTLANEIYNKYVKTRKELGLSYDIVYSDDLELKYLPEKYHKYNNLFVFIVMKYISKLTKVRGVKKTTDGVFASQLSTNLYLLSRDSLKENEKELFLKSIKELYDMIEG